MYLLEKMGSSHRWTVFECFVHGSNAVETKHDLTDSF